MIVDPSQRVLLVDIDGVIPNLALMKVASFFKTGGASVGFHVDDPTDAYISVILKKDRPIANMCANMLASLYPGINIDIGGPGYDVKKTLPDCIESCQPDYSLYPGIDYALGFTTRGCIRKCPFCIVPIKEGKLHRIQSIRDIYRPEYHAIKLLDNNILADRDNFKEVVEFCESHNLKLDISQGLDIRLLDDELASLIARVKPLKKLDFAFDSMRYKSAVYRGIQLLKIHGVDVRGKVQFYVYCDRSVTGQYGIESAIKRCQILKAQGTNAYVMLNIDQAPTQDMKNLKRWANRKQLYWSIDFKDYRTGAIA